MTIALIAEMATKSPRAAAGESMSNDKVEKAQTRAVTGSHAP